MFDDVVAKPDSSIDVEQAEELYRNVLRNTMEKGANTWRVDAYLTSLKKADPCLVSVWAEIVVLERQQLFFGRLVQCEPTSNCMGVHSILTS